MKNPCPECLLWRYLRYILKNRENMTSAKKALRLMKFDARTNIRKLQPMTIEDIEARLAVHYAEVKSFDRLLPAKRKNSKSQSRYIYQKQTRK